MLLSRPVREAGHLPARADGGVGVNRPLGITILAILAGVAGFMQLVIGLDLLGAVVFGPARAGSHVSLAGWSSLILGFIWVSVAGALWSLKPWAWMFGLIMSIFAVIDGVFVALSGDNTFASGFGIILFPLIVLFYLNSAHIKAAFLMSEA
jgi:hypothetical protein